MKRTIDLSYKEISDNQEGNYLFGISTQTIQNAIKDLEDSYFQSQNIFRKDDKTSSYIFRWEIVGLLKLLIWLQVSDVLSEKNSKKSGNTKIDIEKIINGYEKLSEENTLKNYERMELLFFSQFEKSTEMLEYMQRAYQSMSQFLILSSISCNQYPHAIFKDIVEKLDILIETLNKNIYLTYKSEEKGISYLTNTDKGRIIPETTEPVVLNLKAAVANAIKRIADQIYDFDEDGVCRRKKKISRDNELQERYLEICGKHIEFVSDTESIEMTEEELISNGGIETMRQEIDDFMSDYFDFIHPKNYKQIPFDIDEIDNNLRQPLKNYIIHYCQFHLFCSGKINIEQWKYANPPDECYDIILEERENIFSYNYKGFKFGSYLPELEKEVRYIVDSSEKLENQQQIFDLVDDHVNQYVGDIKIHEEIKEIRLERITNDLQKINSVSKEVKGIQQGSESLIKNMLSIILKLEDADMMCLW